MRTLTFALTLATAMHVALPQALAAGGRPKYQLDWDRAGEVLTYQSCGCADSCWTAELRAARKLKARLRCDCEKLYFAKGQELERQIADSCDELNGSTKMQAIPQRMKELEAK